MGDKLIELLISEGLVETVADLYRLTEEQLKGLDRLAEKSARNTVAAITASKHPVLWRFVYGLGIREVGEATAKALARHYGSLEALSEASVDDLQTVADVGPIVAGHIVSFFKQTHNRDTLQSLKDAGSSGKPKPLT